MSCWQGIFLDKWHKMCRVYKFAYIYVIRYQVVNLSILYEIHINNKIRG